MKPHRMLLSFHQRLATFLVASTATPVPATSVRITWPVVTGAGTCTAFRCFIHAKILSLGMSETVLTETTPSLPPVTRTVPVTKSGWGLSAPSGRICRRFDRYFRSVPTVQNQPGFQPYRLHLSGGQRRPLAAEDLLLPGQDNKSLSLIHTVYPEPQGNGALGIYYTRIMFAKQDSGTRHSRWILPNLKQTKSRGYSHETPDRFREPEGQNIPFLFCLFDARMVSQLGAGACNLMKKGFQIGIRRRGAGFLEVHGLAAERIEAVICK